jgi:hypothetical protein
MKAVSGEKERERGDTLINISPRLATLELDEKGIPFN